MWKREQACFVGPVAASNGIWAEGEETVLTLSAVQGQKGGLEDSTDPPPAPRPLTDTHTHWGWQRAGQCGASQLGLASSAAGFLQKGSPFPHPLCLPGHPWLILGKQGGGSRCCGPQALLCSSLLGVFTSVRCRE